MTDWWTDIGIGMAAFTRKIPLRGRTVLFSAVAKVALREGMVSLTDRHGFHYSLPAASSQTWNLLATGRYDEEILFLILNLTPFGGTIVDVGASMGLYTIPLAGLGKKTDIRVIAIEPLPRNIEILRGNVALNDLSNNVEIVASALDQHAGDIWLFSESAGFGNAAIETSSGSVHPSLTRRARVQATRLDSLLDECPISVLKIDVEGHEHSVLKGASSIIQSARPWIIGEFHRSFLAARATNGFELLKFFDRHDYSVFTVRLSHRHLWSDSRVIQLERLTGLSNEWDALACIPREREVWFLQEFQARQFLAQ